MMITLEQITLEGYGSMVRRTTFPLTSSGLTVLRGKIGTGKTTIPSALTWALFGTTLKKGSTVETWETIQPEDYKGTYVRVDFTKGSSKYAVIRCISYKGNVLSKTKGGSKLLVLKDGELILTERNKTDVQKYITKLVGYSFDLFTNSIVFGQRLKRIIEESGPNKKRIFDEAFETLFIDQAKKKVDEKRKDTKDVIQKLDDKIDVIQDKIETAQEFYKDALEFEKSFAKAKKLNIHSIMDNIREVDSTLTQLNRKINDIKDTNIQLIIDEIEDYEDKLKKIEKKKKKLTQFQNELENIDKDLSESIRDLTRLSDKKCYTCNQVIGKDKIEELRKKLQNKSDKAKKHKIEIKRSIKELDISGLNERDKKLHKKLLEARDTLSSKRSDQRRVAEIKAEKEKAEKRKTQLQEQYKDEKSRKLIIKSVKHIDKATKLIKKSDKLEKKKRLLTKQEELQTWLIKDPLSNSGLKAYIFDSLLGKVNEQLYKYSELIGFRIEFGIDLESGNKDFYQIIYKDDNIINYPDLSGGQKQLVDTTVALAIHDVISSVRPINLLFMDEPFEGLDNDTIDTVAEIVSYKAKSQNVFLITHHTSFNPTNSNTIYFKLEEGRTVIE